MSGYTPESPAPTPVPCEGEPWRFVDGVVECLSQPPLAQSGLGDWSTALTVGAVVLVVGFALTVWSARRDAKRGVS